MNIPSGSSISFTDGSEQQREADLMVDDLNGVINLVVDRLWKLKVSRDAIITAVVGNLMNTAIAYMKHVGVTRDEDCLEWFREQLRICNEGAADEQG